MEINELKPIVEAMIFVADEPITVNSIALALQDAGIEKAQVKECIAAIVSDLNENAERGIQLSEVAGGYQFRTKENCAEWLKRLSVPKPMRLSGPALETLAIVAYKQPIVRSEIENVRGVDSGGVLKTLLERRLLRIVGKRDEPGQPLLYGTTKEFLEIFNLKTLKELPTLRDIDDLLRERRLKTETPERAADGEEEQTEVIDYGEEDEDEEEEATKEIKRYPLDEDKEAEDKDMEALGQLEQNLKDLRKLEKEMFPKPIPQVNIIQPGDEDAVPTDENAEDERSSSAQTTDETARAEAVAAEELAGQDAASTDDRPVE